MSFDFEDRKPEYTSPNGAIVFFSNSNHGADAYDVVINKESHFYIPPRTLHELTSPNISTLDMMRSLEAMCKEVHGILFDNRLTAQDLHIALLHLQNNRLESERDAAYKTINEQENKILDLRDTALRHSS